VAEVPKFRSSVPILPKPPAETKVWIIDASGQSKVLIKAAPASPVVAEIAVPFGRSRRYNADVLAAGVRPGEWLLIGRSTAVGKVMGELSPAGHIAVVDYSHARAMVRIVGPKSVSTLEKLCSVDFSEDMFPKVGVATAKVAGVVCDLVRDDIAEVNGSGTLVSFLILFDRSYGVYLAGALFDSMVEFVS
jgi:heterotetrameric sarcosine oxidase gamma subunit